MAARALVLLLLSACAGVPAGAEPPPDALAEAL
jgi:hypothetical protein